MITKEFSNFIGYFNQKLKMINDFDSNAIFKMNLIKIIGYNLVDILKTTENFLDDYCIKVEALIDFSTNW